MGVIANVAIIGAGRGGTSLVEIFQNDPLVKIIGVAEINSNAPGVKLARRLKIPVTRDYRKLLRSGQVDLLIDVTGDSEVERALLELKYPGVAVIGGPSAKFMWQLIEERIRSKEAIERHLTEYQSLYRLYVQEVSLAILEERARIAWDIHDGLVQTLVGLTYKMDLCQELIDSNPVLCRERLSESRRHLKEAIQEARQVIFNLKPLSFEHLELFPALRNYLRSYGHQYKIETSLQTQGSEEKLLPKSKIVIFRIIQEALSNIQKHAKAKRVEVKLRIDRRTLRVTIIDDGIGFDPRRVAEDPEKWASFGLKAIMERAKLLGGTSQVESTAGEGARVLVQIPLEERRTKLFEENQGSNRR